MANIIFNLKVNNIDKSFSIPESNVISFNAIREAASAKNINVVLPDECANNPLAIPTIFTSIKTDGTARTVDTIDFGGITINTTAELFALNAKHIKNLNITNNSLSFGSSKANNAFTRLTTFDGNINITGNSNSAWLTMFFKAFVEEARGNLNVEGVRELNILHGTGTSSAPQQCFNVLDIRNIDTSQCTKVQLLALYNQPCTIIVGNFSNENLLSWNSETASNGFTYWFLSGAPARGITLVHTREIPPKLKNCQFENGVPIDQYENTLTHDWIAKGNKIGKILVPEEYAENYYNDVYVEGGTVGNTGWSYYGTYGKNIIETYKSGEYEPRADKKWLYKHNRWE